MAQGLRKGREDEVLLFVRADPTHEFPYIRRLVGMTIEQALQALVEDGNPLRLPSGVVEAILSPVLLNEREVDPRSQQVLQMGDVLRLRTQRPPKTP